MPLRLLIYYLLTLTIIINSSCKTNPSTSEEIRNDTTEIFSLLLNKDFLGRNMPGYGALQRPSIFGDTIVFQSDSIVSGHLPESLNGFHFKFLTHDQICQQSTLYHTDTTDFPNFFQIKRFQKKDSIYDVALQVTCVIPLFDKDGKKLFDNAAHKTNKCIFGMLCGGGIGVTVYRESDTVKIRKETSWSD